MEMKIQDYQSVDTGKLIADCINEVANDAPMHFSMVWRINR